MRNLYTNLLEKVKCVSVLSIICWLLDPVQCTPSVVSSPYFLVNGNDDGGEGRDFTE